MRISLIGAGNVGSHLGKVLKAKGHQIGQVFSRRLEKAERLANIVEAEAVNELSAIEQGAEVYIIAVSDKAIEEVSAQLRLNRGVVAHTSGAASIDLLDSHAQFGSFYPLQTFTPNRQPNWQEIPICLNANNVDTFDTLYDLAETINDNIHHLTDDERTNLHVGAVVVNNFINHLLGVTREITDSQKVPYELLLPLLNETIAKSKNAHPFDIQTGPAKRNDVETIEKHLSLLPEAYHHLYNALTKSIQEHHKVLVN